MTAADYEELIVLHLCDGCDCVNAKFAWMRTPEPMRAELAQTHQVLVALSENKYGHALLLMQYTPWHRLLKRTIQSLYVPQLVASGYQSIAKEQLKQMLHVQTDRELAELLDANFVVEGDAFVSLVVRQKQGSGFRLDA